MSLRRRVPARLVLAGLVAAVGVPATAASATTVKAAPAARLGISSGHLVDAQGRALYVFAQDRLNVSTCVSKACTGVWMPYTVKAAPRATAGVRRTLVNTVARAGGAKQVTYAGHPLYRYVLDTKAGTTKGQGVVEFGASWFLVAPSGAAIIPPVVPLPPAGTPVLASIPGSGAASTLGVPYAHLSFFANKTAAGTNGYFQGTIDALGVRLAGPITCLDVRGDDIGFLYPINYSNPPGLNGTAILITLVKGTNKLGFLGPAPAGLFGNTCAPNAAPFDYTGTLTVSTGPTAVPVAPPVYSY